jgi:FAD:protein FMN transferase
MRLTVLCCCLTFICMAFAPVTKPVDDRPSAFSFSYEQVLGTSFDLKVWSHSEALAEKAEQRALAEIDRWASILSSYDAGSEFSRWASSRGIPVKVSPELFRVLSQYDEWTSKTGGALTPGAAAVIEVWKKAEMSGQMPKDHDILEAVRKAGSKHWTLDPLTGTATRRSDIPLVMNSFVKSYILQQVSNTLMSMEGITGARVNIGGDIVSAGYTPETVRVTNPFGSDNGTPLAIIEANGMSVATSGDYKRGFDINGQHLSHIVDPRTGRPEQGIAAATVVAADASTAGALATAFNILTPEESKKLAAAHPGSEYLLITRDGKRIESDGWKSLERSNPVAKSSEINISTQGSWEKDASVTVKFELKRFESRARRPFIAVWVEDKDGKLVKTLALWFNKPRWVPDLKAWYRKHGQKEYKEPTDMHSLGSATRPAGSYNLSWDGRNDDGELVDAGDYTIHVEAVREHGGYELLEQKLTCKRKGQKKEVKGSVELDRASFEYVRK